MSNSGMLAFWTSHDVTKWLYIFFHQDSTDNVADLREAVANSADNGSRQAGGSFAVFEVQVSRSEIAFRVRCGGRNSSSEIELGL
jgi:hypothetical protein